MAGFKLYNLAALSVGLAAGVISDVLLPHLDWLAIAAIMFSGYLGGHLPAIQQPSTESYQVIRASTALAVLLGPITASLYRPTDIVLGIIATYLLYQGLWWLIDRVSLYRDYTRHTFAVVLLPLLVTAIGYITVGPEAVVAVFLSTSLSYILHLILDQRHHLVEKTSL